MQVKINVKDKILLNVVEKMVERSDIGIKKYGATLEDDKSGLVFFLKQVQTELMDAVLYVQRLKEEVTTLKEELELLQANDMNVKDAHIVRRGDHYDFTIYETNN